MSKELDEYYAIDRLATQAGGYVTPPTEDEIAYTNLLFDICRQFHIRYYSATAKEKNFVEKVTRVTWAKMQEAKTGKKQDVRPAFTV